MLHTNEMRGLSSAARKSCALRRSVQRNASDAQIALPFRVSVWVAVACTLPTYEVTRTLSQREGREGRAPSLIYRGGRRRGGGVGSQVGVPQNDNNDDPHESIRPFQHKAALGVKTDRLTCTEPWLKSSGWGEPVSTSVQVSFRLNSGLTCPAKFCSEKMLPDVQILLPF